MSQDQERFLGRCRATGIGSLPQADPDRAVRAVMESAPDLPYWPQLPRRSRREGMNEQAAAGLPGLRIAGDTRKLTLVADEEFAAGLEKILTAHEAGDTAPAALAAADAAALAPFLGRLAERGVKEAKGQLAGPITVGMGILDEQGLPILYDELLRDLLVKFLNLRLRWQAEKIAAAGARPVVFLDEPFLTSYGTPFFGWDKEQVLAVINAAAANVGVTGSHCCSNTEWTLFLESDLDIVSFDAFAYAENFLAYESAVTAFLERGGTIAWGAVPTEPAALASATVESLRSRLEPHLAKVTGWGFARGRLLEQSLITPACGLGTREPAVAAKALALTRELAAALAAG